MSQNQAVLIHSGIGFDGELIEEDIREGVREKNVKRTREDTRCTSSISYHDVSVIHRLIARAVEDSRQQGLPVQITGIATPFTFGGVFILW